MLYNIITLCISYSFITDDDIFEKYKKLALTRAISASNKSYCKFGNSREGFIFAKLRECEVFVKIKPSRNGEIRVSMSVTDVGKSCPSLECSTWQICLLPVMLFVKKTFEPLHEISNNVVCATSKGSDQPAHTRRLSRAYASRLIIL